ncbi:MAG: hypothetical protein L0G49_14200 [Luteococcus sp.]|nr:hypothetical protein [Luteococcus sp.]MDN5564887.1 hypothetical protein [Luteococcus sp.]
MTDEHHEQPRPEEVEDWQIVEPEETTAAPHPESGSETTPAKQQKPATEPDHSAWMRPAVGDDMRTSEVVGALAPPEPEVLPEAEPVDVFDEAAPVTPDENPAELESPALSTEQAAAVAGARAALARHDVPGASLDHAPESYPEDTFTTHDDAPRSWTRMIPWIAGALALTLVVFGLVYSGTRKSPIVVTPSPTPTVSTPPVVDDADLLTVADVEKIAPKAGWEVSQTFTKLTPTTRRIFCQNSTDGQANPTLTRQRTLTTTSTKGLAALHQIDAYATAADARNAFASKAANLATCGDVPTWIKRADAVTGFGDEAASVSVVMQDLVNEEHTILLSRSGTVVHAYDISQVNKGVSVNDVLKGASQAMNRQCATSGGECAQRPSTHATVPPPTGTPGWLIPSDLPRVTKGAGLWTSTDTRNVTTKGSQCENVTLASVPGPTKREQRTYLMTQDDAAPQTFGIDEVTLTFKDDKTARGFADTLQKNVRECEKRLETAKVSEFAKVASPFNKKVTIVGDTALVQQAMGGTETARFRTAVVSVGNKVVYLVSNPSASYDLGNERFVAVAVRAAERATQE